MGRERRGGGIELINRINQLGRQKKEEKSGEAIPSFLCFLLVGKEAKKQSFGQRPDLFPSTCSTSQKSGGKYICTCARTYTTWHTFITGTPRKGRRAKRRRPPLSSPFSLSRAGVVKSKVGRGPLSPLPLWHFRVAKSPSSPFPTGIPRRVGWGGIGEGTLAVPSAVIRPLIVPPSTSF